jgi:hypothetical protein
MSKMRRSQKGKMDMDDLHQDIKALGEALDMKLREYTCQHGNIPERGPAARLLELQKAQADLMMRANGTEKSVWEASKITLEAERKALHDSFSKWVALIDAQYQE